MPEFICVECDPSLLLASAAMLAREQGLEPSQGLEAAARTYHQYPELGPWIVRSVQEWEARHGGFAAGQAQAMIAADRRHAGFRERREFYYAPSEALVSTAGAFARELAIPSDRMAPALRAVFGSHAEQSDR